jgi:Amt family ammonium transporter
MSQEQMEIGDYAIHGEEPYTFAHYNIKHPTPPLMRRRTTKKGDEETQKDQGVLMGKDPAITVDRAPSSGDSIKEMPEKGTSTGASTGAVHTQ